MQLKTYSSEQLKIVGQLIVQVCYGGEEAQLPLVVLAGSGLSLIGCEWLSHLCLDCQTIHKLHGADAE